MCSRKEAFACACTIARCFPLYSAKTHSKSPRKVTVEFLLVDGPPLTAEDTQCMTTAAESIRLAARIVDTPCNDMHTDIFLEVTIHISLCDRDKATTIFFSWPTLTGN